MIRKLFICITLCFTFCFTSTIKAQNTVGTTFITEDVFEAYTLISIHTKAFLLDNCGQVINEWNSQYPPGNAVYLLPNGNLLRAGRLDDESSNITFGGQGGIIELFNWDGDLIWSYTYSSNQFRQHHDVFPMPNGNVLILAATSITDTQAIAAGRDPSTLLETRLYGEQIIEVEPVGATQGNIVWEWNIIDHLIQDFDNTKDNFGDVAMSPEKLDINFLNGGNGSPNWLHFNSIQYDENLDQIVASARNLSEIYVIDHSTSIAESASSTGGIYGKGGDFLYRWGNPQSYRQGTEADRILYGQHYPHYIEEGLTDAGKLIVFNNGNGRTPLFSDVLIFNPPTSSPGVYDYTPGSAYGPSTADYTYSDQSVTPSEFYSGIVSSAQRLPNGNTLICEGRSGEVFEIDNNDNIVWEYINPMSNNNGTVSTQGNPPPGTNILFRAIKYAPNFSAFTGRDLTPSAPLELNPDLSPCNSLSIAELDVSQIKVYPNPASNYINVTSTITIDKIELYSILGKKVHETANANTIDISNLNSGIYFVQFYSGNRNITKKIIKE